MSVAIPAILLSIAAGMLWLTKVYLPKQRRLKTERYLEIIGDEGTDGIETGFRNSTRSRSGSSKRDSMRYRYARLRQEAPWSQLSCSLNSQDVPNQASPFVHESPTELNALYCWGHAPEAAEQMRVPSVTAAIRVFLSGEGHRSIIGGTLQIEMLASQADPMQEISMMTDIVLLKRILG